MSNIFYCLCCCVNHYFLHVAYTKIPVKNSTFKFQLNDFDIRNGKKIGVTISFNNHRLFVGNIPKNRDRDELIEEFKKHARKCNLKKNEQNKIRSHPFLH